MKQKVISKTFTQKDVDEWQRITGDMNKLHYDVEFCKDTRFGRPILPGLLVASMFSNLFGSIDGAIYCKQNLIFLKPAFAEEKLTAKVRYVGNNTWACSITNEEDNSIIEGTARIIIK